MAEASLRLDKFLWFSRLAKTRSLAQATAETGHLRINGRAVDRAHAAVRIGNVLSFPLHDRVRIIRVDALPPRRGPSAEARACYTDLDECQTRENVSQTGRDIDAPEHAT